MNIAYLSWFSDNFSSSRFWTKRASAENSDVVSSYKAELLLKSSMPTFTGSRPLTGIITAGCAPICLRSLFPKFWEES